MTNLTDAMKNVDTATREEELVIRAAVSNALMIRAQQTGRTYVTPRDVKKKDIIVAIILDEQQADAASDTMKYAPQTQLPDPDIHGTLQALESALKPGE